MKYIRSDLCQLGWISCIGCCGHSFKEKKDVARGIQKNTLEFERHVSEGKSLHNFMNRSKDLRESGICRNIVYDVKKDTVFCPLHPEVNNGKDIRPEHKHCDILHVCKTAFLFQLWDDNTRKDFIKFLRQKRRNSQLDWYTYSTGMAKDTFLEEFEGLKWD